MLVIRSLPEIYEKYKKRWIAEEKDRGLEANAFHPSQLWNRLNHDRLTPLTLAADLGRTKMLTWLLQERRKTQWSFGDVTCVLHPLAQLDLEFNEKVNPSKICSLNNR